MKTESITLADLQHELQEIAERAEKEKIKIPPEIRTFIREHLELVFEKLKNKKNLYPKDFDFIDDLRKWTSLPEEWRLHLNSIDEMKSNRSYLLLPWQNLEIKR